MSKIDKILFAIFVIIVQLLQFVIVYSIAWFNSHVIEFLVVFLNFQINRKCFGISYHAEKLSKCTLLSVVIFYIIIKSVWSIHISIFIPVLAGVYLAYLLNYIEKLIENQNVPKVFIRKPLREQILEILDGKITEEEIDTICIMNNINLKVSETVFLYLTNSKDTVSEILDIDPSTVIRRLKTFIKRVAER